MSLYLAAIARKHRNTLASHPRLIIEGPRRQAAGGGGPQTPTPGVAA